MTNRFAIKIHYSITESCPQQQFTKSITESLSVATIHEVQWNKFHTIYLHSFLFNTTSSTIFQLLYVFQIIRFVKPNKELFCFPFNFFVRFKTPSTQLSLGGNRQGPSLENTVDAEAIRNPICAFLPVKSLMCEMVQCNHEKRVFCFSNVAISS